MRQKYLLCIFLLVTMLLPPTAGAATIEQVQAVMPEISVYLHDDDGAVAQCDKNQIKATLEGEALTVDSLTPSEQGVFYIFMMDVSASIPSAYFQSAKQAVLDTYSKMRQQDRLAVISFGSEVRLLLDGSESPEQVTAALDNLACKDAHTRFYEAMNLLIQTASEVEDMRRVAVVISDGVDDADATMSRQELERLLQQSGVAVYALGIDTVTAGAVESFRSFIRLSGGELYLFSPNTVDAVLSDLLSRIGGIWKLGLRANHNLADGQAHTLTVELGAAGSVTAQVLTEQWTPDDKPPYLLSCEADADAGTITLGFSEPVSGLDRLESYVLHDPEGQLVPVSISSAERDRVVLALQGLTEQAGWMLDVEGLTDLSMEKNSMAELSVPLFNEAGVTELSKTTEDTAAVPSGRKEGLHALVLLAVVILGIGILAVLLVLWVKFRHKKPREKTEEKPAQPAGKQTVRFLFQSDESADHSRKK